MIFNDKNILTVKDGNKSYVSVNGDLVKINGELIKCWRKKKIIIQGKHEMQKIFEILIFGNSKIYYDASTGYWKKQEVKT